MSFFIKSVNVAYPCGVIIAYVGSTDPEGWLICDGRAFSGISGNFDALKTLLGSATNLPDLRNRTLLGKSSINTSPAVSSNSNTTYTLLENNLPQHNHVTLAITAHPTDGHTHTYNDRYHSDADNGWVETTNNESPDGGDYTTIREDTFNSGTVSHTHNLANGYAGGGTAINFLNKCYRTNWIIKY